MLPGRPGAQHSFSVFACFTFSRKACTVPWACPGYVALPRFVWFMSGEQAVPSREVSRLHPGFTQTAGEPQNRGRLTMAAESRGCLRASSRNHPLHG
jgi:hypothetical protein